MIFSARVVGNCPPLTPVSVNSVCYAGAAYFRRPLPLKDCNWQLPEPSANNAPFYAFPVYPLPPHLLGFASIMFNNVHLLCRENGIR